jgi:hypothetical protein
MPMVMLPERQPPADPRGQWTVVEPEEEPTLLEEAHAALARLLAVEGDDEGLRNAVAAAVEELQLLGRTLRP